MQVVRHYYISSDLDDLEEFEEQLEARGIATPQIHVLSLHDTDVENHHHLHNVTSFMKTDVVRSGEIGLGVGILLSSSLLALAYFAGWTSSPVGWIPFIFFSIILLGFSTWEGGFIGIQRSNKHFERFEKELEAGKHIFFVDVEPQQEAILAEVAEKHRSKVTIAGTEKGTPHWVMEGQKRIPKMLQNF